MRAWMKMVAAAGLAALDFHAASAASLQVSPVTVEVHAPAGATAITLRNSGQRPLTAQVRIYRWQERNGAEQLIETRDVVASPPIGEVPPNGIQLVRLVRVTKAPIGGEESYRVWVDEIPQAATVSRRSVEFAVRYSVPLFFVGTPQVTPRLEWQLYRRAGKVVLTARNIGDQRVRVSALRLHSPSGKAASFGDGLLGYVLAQSAMEWTLPGALQAATGDAITIAAMTDRGPVQTTAVLQDAR